jgi:hypothetical protein
MTAHTSMKSEVSALRSVTPTPGFTSVLIKQDLEDCHGYRVDDVDSLQYQRDYWVMNQCAKSEKNAFR